MSLPDPGLQVFPKYDPECVKESLDVQESEWLAFYYLDAGPLPFLTTFCKHIIQDDIKGSLLCATTRCSPTDRCHAIPHTHTTAIFEVVGCIDLADCFLAPDRDQTHPQGSETVEDNLRVSFWLKACHATERDARAWEWGLDRLQHVLPGRPGKDSDIDELVKQGHGPHSSSKLLQIHWKPPRGCTREHLPVFTSDYEQYPIQSTEAVPFGKRVSVRFTLHEMSASAKRGRRNGTLPLIRAYMASMRILD